MYVIDFKYYTYYSININDVVTNKLYYFTTHLSTKNPNLFAIYLVQARLDGGSQFKIIELLHRGDKSPFAKLSKNKIIDTDTMEPLARQTCNICLRMKTIELYHQEIIEKIQAL